MLLKTLKPDVGLRYRFCLRTWLCPNNFTEMCQTQTSKPMTTKVMKCSEVVECRKTFLTTQIASVQSHYIQKQYSVMGGGLQNKED